MSLSEILKRADRNSITQYHVNQNEHSASRAPPPPSTELMYCLTSRLGVSPHVVPIDPFVCIHSLLLLIFLVMP